jgi:hypothetical protein
MSLAASNNIKKIENSLNNKIIGSSKSDSNDSNLGFAVSLNPE